MESEVDYTADDGDDLTSGNDLKEDKIKDKKDKSKGNKGKKRKVKKKKLKKIKLPKEMVMNDQGEIVTAKEYVLDKTYILIIRLATTTKSLHACQKRLEQL